MATIEFCTSIAAAPERVFDLSRDVGTHAASMKESREAAVDGLTEGLLDLGDMVTWQARHLGMTRYLTARIVEMDRPSRFVDVQVDGPFATWWHEHRFEADDGGTRMLDHVEYKLRFGPIGRVADRLMLHRYLARLVANRNEYVKRAAEAPDHAGDSN